MTAVETVAAVVVFVPAELSLQRHTDPHPRSRQPGSPSPQHGSAGTPAGRGWQVRLPGSVVRPATDSYETAAMSGEGAEDPVHDPTP